MAKKRVKGRASAKSSRASSAIHRDKKFHKVFIIIAVIAAVLIIAGLFSDRSYYISSKERSDAKYLLTHSQCFAGMNLDAESVNVLINKYDHVSIQEREDGTYGAGIYVTAGKNDLDFLDAGYLSQYGYGAVTKVSDISAWKIRGGRLSDDHAVFKGCVLFVDASGNVLLQFGNEYDKNNPEN